MMWNLLSPRLKKWSQVKQHHGGHLKTCDTASANQAAEAQVYNGRSFVKVIGPWKSN